MRVIAGSARGRALQAPRGLSTRPMMDIVKGSLFNMLDSMGAIRGSVLDLFAGSGALGIEALSRGAPHAVFVESSRDAARTLKGNLERLGFSDRGRIVTSRVESFLSSAKGPFDLVFMDAPYLDRVSDGLLAQIAHSDLLTPEAAVCVGHARREELPEAAGALRRVRLRRFGASCISIYTRPDSDGMQEGVE